jgi:Tfp pilus assembly protein PilP
VNGGLRNLLAPLLALVLLILIGVQTSDALRRSGAWSARSRAATQTPVDPYASLERQLARTDQGYPAAGLRDPFAFGSTPQPPRPVVVRRVVPPPPPKPVLTANIQDREDPRALLQYEDRNYSVKTGDLFAEFRVVSITGEQVVLDGRGQRLILTRPTKKGE